MNACEPSTSSAARPEPNISDRVPETSAEDSIAHSHSSQDYLSYHGIHREDPYWPSKQEQMADLGLGQTINEPGLALVICPMRLGERAASPWVHSCRQAEKDTASAELQRGVPLLARRQRANM